MQNFKNKSVDASRYAMVPRADVPRSSFKTSSSHKTTFNCGDLIPIYLDEVLPGDSHSIRMTAFCRLGTVLFPIMDNLHLDTFFFFVPNRLLWSNWVKMMGEQEDPTDSTSFVVPTIQSAVAGWPIGSLGDFFGLPTVGQVGGAAQVTTSSLPFRAYNLIHKEWFRDQNLQVSQPINMGDGPDAVADYVVLQRNKRPDYFTTCLPWPQKPNSITGQGPYNTGPTFYHGAAGADFKQIGAPVSGIGFYDLSLSHNVNQVAYESGDLSGVTYAEAKNAQTAGLGSAVFVRQNEVNGLPDITVTIDAIRRAFQVQKFQERDARGGTRYTELLRSHFGVQPQDSRLQRPEYLGGGSSPVQISPIAQQSATGLTGATTPLGHLSATATGVAQNHGFSQSFSEHGWIIGIACVRGDLNYQHGVHKMWHRATKYDYYWPEFAHLSEQAVLMRELYMDGSATDITVFGFQERWAEYRSKPGIVTGKFRSSAAGTLDAWHLGQKWVAGPPLNSNYIVDGTYATVKRVLAAGAAADGQQVLFDAFFDLRRVRAIPTFSVPGLVDHF